MKDNTRTAIGYICIALCIMSYFTFMAIAIMPTEFTIDFDVGEGALEMMETANNISMNQEKESICYSEICYLDLYENQIGGCSMTKVNCMKFKEKFALDMEDAE